MVGRTNARNTTQRAGNITRVSDRVTNSPVGVYTCPAKTEARITDILGVVDATGSDATICLAIRRVGGTYDQISRLVGNTAPDNVTSASAVTLVAGEILTDIGDSGGTNGGMDISATIEEFGVP